jgi:hypothetical protein
MTIYSAGRGRRKAVKKFRASDGLWILGIVALFLVLILCLIVKGYINVDSD